MKYCDECGTALKSGTKFCTNCGKRIELSPPKKLKPEKPKQSKPKTTTKSKPKNRQAQSSTDFTAINKKLNIDNNQTKIVSRSWFVAAICAIIIISAIMEILPIHSAAFFLSIFFMICAIVIALIFKSREEKLKTLISGDNLFSELTLTAQQKKKYANHQFEQKSGMNVLILLVIGVNATVVFGLFILMIEEGKLFMFFVLIGLIVFLSLFAFGMPFYYKFTNSKGDGRILIGAKYAYINGYFHNWDFVMSGLSKIKIIKEPFYGLCLEYYYTDRTYKHSETLTIPANEGIDLKFLITQLKELNK